eukprot:SAG22_NODE_124_length_18884_cov_34.149367_8_plen_398_part_00
MQRALKQPAIEALTSVTSGCPTVANGGAYADARVGDGFCDADIPGFAGPACGYDGGDCLIPLEDRQSWGDTDLGWTGLVFLSIECASLYFNGEIEMAGYVGSRTSFDAAGGSSCSVCPGDTLFGGQPNRNADGDFVCNSAPEGTVDTGIDVLSGTACNTSADGIGRDCLDGEVAIVVHPKYEAAFPPVTRQPACVDPLASARPGGAMSSCGDVTGRDLATKKKCTKTVVGALCALKADGSACATENSSLLGDCTYAPAAGGSNASCTGETDGSKQVKCSYIAGTPYRVALSSGQGNEEVVYVQHATAYAGGKQTLAVTAPRGKKDADSYKPLKLKHMHRAELISAITKDSATVVVRLPASEQSRFDTIGPYTVYIRAARSRSHPRKSTSGPRPHTRS